MASYRPNVALLLLDAEERLLVCERVKIPGAWQFPQGGVDKGESLEDALFREVCEEIGLPPWSYQILRFRHGYRYDFPPHLKKSKSYKGQEQTYYLCQLREGAPEVDVNQRPREFKRHRWIRPSEFSLGWLPEFKHEVYRRVMDDFFGVEL